MKIECNDVRCRWHGSDTLGYITTEKETQAIVLLYAVAEEEVSAEIEVQALATIVVN